MGLNIESLARNERRDFFCKRLSALMHELEHALSGHHSQCTSIGVRNKYLKIPLAAFRYSELKIIVCSICLKS